MAILHDITNTIGRTPLVKLHRVSAGLPATTIELAELSPALADSIRQEVAG